LSPLVWFFLWLPEESVSLAISSSSWEWRFLYSYERYLFFQFKSLNWSLKFQLFQLCNYRIVKIHIWIKLATIWNAIYQVLLLNKFKTRNQIWKSKCIKNDNGSMNILFKNINAANLNVQEYENWVSKFAIIKC